MPDILEITVLRTRNVVQMKSLDTAHIWADLVIKAVGMPTVKEQALLKRETIPGPVLLPASADMWLW